MHFRTRTLGAPALTMCAVVGCATVDPKPDYDRVSRQIEAATGQAAAIDPADVQAVKGKVAELLADGLTSMEAVQLSLLNNPKLQADFLRIGIGRAAVVQSGLFSNPGLALSLRFPDEGGLANFEVSLAQNIAELWQIRYRKDAAQRDLDQAILTVAREASVVALEARRAYVRALQAARQLEIARQNFSIAEQLIEVAGARRQAGSGTEVDVNLSRAEGASLEVAARTALVNETEARANLAKLIGLTTPPAGLRLVDALPEAPELSFTAEHLIELALANRVDRKAADAVIAASQARVQFERARFLKTVELGISMERDERRSRGDRNWLSETAWASAQAGALTLPSLQPREAQTTDYVTGPTLSMELPLFDQNQAQVARAEYELLGAQYLKESIDREIVQDSWSAHTRARTAFETAAFIRGELLPLRENGLTLAREAYRVGSGTLITVLDAQRRLLEARGGYVDVQAAAGLAGIDLERISGRPFTELSAPAQGNAAPPSELEP
jgi:cobalt-zinc-cadmium efflux system outer membrane protein